MPEFRVETPQRAYSAIVERGLLSRVCEYLPTKRGRIFVISTADVWRHQGTSLARGLAGVSHERLDLPGGEDTKRLAPLEALAD